MKCTKCSGVTKRRSSRKSGATTYKCVETACGITFKAKGSGTRPNYMTGPVCSLCGGPTSKLNKTGICTTNSKCRKAWYKIHDKKTDDKRAESKKTDRPGTHRRYPERPHELFEDNIVDETAIELAVNGVRKVRLTPNEQGLAAKRMIRMSYSTGEVMSNLGVSEVNLREILNAIGYEIVWAPHGERKVMKRRAVSDV